ncbi:helix-turn-helix domain-containing protein [Dorea sp. AM13-35]|uniref:helix-turn-helix domain-containing protein n=1 Tax=Dorea sp. AM13-35 TaxID=2293099 RepID=UPI000E48CA74|nr:helix-turn-helix transcriptional regulator [Dorea sp. AM13-35]RHO42857.1 XRE family transcriptional regulator [Dorea sp. AM13-35]WAX12379.1 hypothetical protein DO134P1_00041 [Dorea phage DO134P1]
MGIFKTVIKSLRTSHGLTQDELSKQLGISRSTIGMYESGAREPDFETLELIADYFNVDTDYLLGRTNKTTYIPSAFKSEDENNLLQSYRNLSDLNKKKSVTYIENLLSNQQLEEELELNAAQARTDIDIPEGTDTSDDDIMDSEDF